MSILNRVVEFKKATQEKFENFFPAKEEKAMNKVQDSVLTDTDVNVTMQGSIPNRLVSLALSAIAAYAVGMNPSYIALATLVSGYYVLLLPGASRILFETAVAANLLCIAISTLPEAAVTALEYLIVFKLLLEIFCLAFDRLTQIYASITKDQKHSYYLFTMIFIFSVKALVVMYATPFLNGVHVGFQAGISSM